MTKDTLDHLRMLINGGHGPSDGRVRAAIDDLEDYYPELEDLNSLIKLGHGRKDERVRAAIRDLAHYNPELSELFWEWTG